MNNQTLTPEEEINNRILAGVNEYDSDVLKMTNEELWEHCFADGDILETDSCTQELKKRFLTQQENQQGQKELLEKFGFFILKNDKHYELCESVEKVVNEFLTSK